jgi:hypothetical protein
VVLESLVDMAEDLTKMWENLALLEDECIELEANNQALDESENYGKLCMVGKLYADRLVCKETIRTKMSRGWKTGGNLSFKVLGENLFLVEFEKADDKKRVLEGRPWVFEGSLFLVEDYDGFTTPSQMSFEKAVFWVQLHNLPLGCMSLSIGRQIGSSVGQVEAIDIDEKGMGWGESLRVKVQIDLRKPLPRGRMLKVRGVLKWIAFKYEKLPKYCFQCGLIRHGVTGCTKKSQYRVQESDFEYGPWLRATSPTRRNGGRGETENSDSMHHRPEGRRGREERRS